MIKLFGIFFVTLNIFSISVAAEKKDWIFVTEMPGKKNQETDSLRIIDGKLELNANATDLIKLEEFGSMIATAKKDNLPFFLVLIIGEDKNPITGKITEFFHFYEGQDAFKFLIEKWKTTEEEYNFWVSKGFPKKKPPAHFVDPANNLKATNIVIFVMGDNNKFTKLKERQETKLSLVDANYINKFVDLTNFIPPNGYTYAPKDALLKKGTAQLFVADLFTEEAQKEIGQKQELLQYARQWYEWALKYLPKNSPEYIRAQNELRLPEPQKSKKPTQPETIPTLLIQSLQNLTRTLHQISTFLT